VVFRTQILFVGLFSHIDLIYESLIAKEEEAIRGTRFVVRFSSEDTTCDTLLIYGSLFTFNSRLWVSFRTPIS